MSPLPGQAGSRNKTSHRLRGAARNSKIPVELSARPAATCSAEGAGGSRPLDQLFVSATARPPRLDLANEALLRAHVHAVWLSRVQLPLGRRSSRSSTPMR